MRCVIDGADGLKIYDTAKATAIACWVSPDDDCENQDQLFMTKSGEYFLVETRGDSIDPIRTMRLLKNKSDLLSWVVECSVDLEDTPITAEQLGVPEA